jgi:xylan 1,4-beta-xylosidase
MQSLRFTAAPARIEEVQPPAAPHSKEQEQQISVSKGSSILAVLVTLSGIGVGDAVAVVGGGARGAALRVGEGAVHATQSAGGDVTRETIDIDATQAGRPFPHFWERVFGSGRAALSLRESYRDDLRRMKRDIGLEYVRFHGIFDDENGVYSEDREGRPAYNWSYVDQIYDGLLANHVRPFVELSFMPAALACSQVPYAFWYKPLPAPPRDYGKWGGLIENFARHLVERYGTDEVSQWYFEVWNEPNIEFWTGVPKQETYFRLYRTTAEALKRASGRLRVGGPATAQAAWIGQFIAWCAREKAPLDFITTHIYANDTSQDVFGTHERIGRRDMVARAVKKVYEEVRSSAMPGVPIHWTEYNASYKNEEEVTDSAFMGPWLANNIRECDGMATTMSYWTFSDVFEEQGVVKTPFYGGFGLIAAGGIPKASFNAFRMLHELGDRRLPAASESALATRREDGSLAIAVWNYSDPEEKGSPREFVLKFRGVRDGAAAQITLLDAGHGSALGVWKSMGSPSHPTREQQARLREAGKLETAEAVEVRGRPLRVKLGDKALALLEVRQ